MRVFKKVVRGFSLVHDLKGDMNKNGVINPVTGVAAVTEIYSGSRSHPLLEA